MDRNVSISINGVVFQIEEQAYEELAEYLKSVRSYFANFDDSHEIISDIESRIDENLSSSVNRKKQVITKNDVANLIKEMGTIEDFDGENESDDNTESNFWDEMDWRSKRLYRHPKDKIIAGVCSGIATYFGIDPTIIRVVFVALIFAGGFMIPIYLILWLIVPVPERFSDHLRMDGLRVTLGKLKNAAQKQWSRLHKDKDSSQSQQKPFNNGNFTKIMLGLKSFTTEIIRLVSIFLKNVGPFLIKVIGGIIVFVTALMISIWTLIVSTIAFNWDSPYINLPISNWPITWHYYGFLLAVGLLVLIPMIVVLIFGASVVRNQYKGLLKVIAVLSLLWLVNLGVAGGTGLRIIPKILELQNSMPTEDMITQIVDLDNFNSIKLGDNVRIDIEQGSEQSIELTIPESYRDKYSLFVEDETLRSKHVTTEKICLFCSTPEVKIKIVSPNVENIYLSGTAYGNWKMSSLLENGAIELSGVAKLTTSGEFSNLKIVTRGASSLKLNDGKADAIEITSDGASKVMADNFPVQTGNLMSDGASRLSLEVIDQLKVTANGASQVLYKGSPELDKKTNAAAVVKQNVDLETDPE